VHCSEEEKVASNEILPPSKSFKQNWKNLGKVCSPRILQILELSQSTPPNKLFKKKFIWSKRKQYVGCKNVKEEIPVPSL